MGKIINIKKKDNYITKHIFTSHIIFFEYANRCTEYVNNLLSCLSFFCFHFLFIPTSYDTHTPLSFNDFNVLTTQISPPTEMWRMLKMCCFLHLNLPLSLSTPTHIYFISLSSSYSSFHCCFSGIISARLLSKHQHAYLCISSYLSVILPISNWKPSTLTENNR